MSMCVMVQTVMYVVEGLETESPKLDFMQQWSDSSESVIVDFIWLSPLFGKPFSQ